MNKEGFQFVPVIFHNNLIRLFMNYLHFHLKMLKCSQINNLLEDLEKKFMRANY